MIEIERDRGEGGRGRERGREGGREGGRSGEWGEGEGEGGGERGEGEGGGGREREMGRERGTEGREGGRGSGEERERGYLVALGSGTVQSAVIPCETSLLFELASQLVFECWGRREGGVGGDVGLE